LVSTHRHLAERTTYRLVGTLIRLSSYLLLLDFLIFLFGGLVYHLCEEFSLARAYYVHLFIFAGNAPPLPMKSLSGKFMSLVDVCAGQLLLPALIGVMGGRIERALQAETLLENGLRRLAQKLNIPEPVASEKVRRLLKELETMIMK